MEALENIFDVLIGGFAIFVLILLFSYGENERLDQVAVDQASKSFTDNVLNNGYVSEEMITRFLGDINLIDVSMSLEMVHRHKVVEPAINTVTGVVEVGQVAEFFEEYYTDEIMDVVRNDSKYYLNKGDYFTVTLANQGTTQFTNLMSSLFRVTDDNTVESVYGGIVRNETN